MPYDPTDPDAVASEERLAAARLQRDLADLRAVLELPEGRRLLWRIMGETAAFRTTYDADNPIRMAFAEGRRCVGLWLLHELQRAAPDVFPQMIAETWAVSQLPTPTTDEDDFLT